MKSTTKCISIGKLESHFIKVILEKQLKHTTQSHIQCKNFWKQNISNARTARHDSEGSQHMQQWKLFCQQLSSSFPSLFLYHCSLRYYPSNFHREVTAHNFPVDFRTLLLKAKASFPFGRGDEYQVTNFIMLINTQFDTYRIPIWSRGASISKVTWKTLKQKRECLLFIIQATKSGLNTEFLQV